MDPHISKKKKKDFTPNAGFVSFGENGKFVTFRYF
jgi:hypothetical protein